MVRPVYDSGGGGWCDWWGGLVVQDCCCVVVGNSGGVEVGECVEVGLCVFVDSRVGECLRQYGCLVMSKSLAPRLIITLMKARDRSSVLPHVDGL